MATGPVLTLERGLGKRPGFVPDFINKSSSESDRILIVQEGRQQSRILRKDKNEPPVAGLLGRAFFLLLAQHINLR